MLRGAVMIRMGSADYSQASPNCQHVCLGFNVLQEFLQLSLYIQRHCSEAWWVFIKTNHTGFIINRRGVAEEGGKSRAGNCMGERSRLNRNPTDACYSFLIPKLYSTSEAH